MEKTKETTMTPTRRELVDKVMTMLEQGTSPWQKEWSGSEYCKNAVSGVEYRGVNQLNLMFAFRDDPRWATFAQCIDNGWSVKKGSKGSKIEVYKSIDTTTNKEISYKELQKKLEGLNAEESAEVLKKIRHFTKNYVLFNAEDIDGIEKYIKPAMSADERTKKNEEIERIISNSEAPIYYDGGDRAYYSIKKDEIHLPKMEDFIRKDAFYATALHEIGHSTSAPSRLNREIANSPFGSPTYAKEELRAEISSMFVELDTQVTFSDEHFANHGAYIASWLEIIKADPNNLFDAIKDADKISDYVLALSSKKESTKMDEQDVEKITEQLAQSPIEKDDTLSKKEFVSPQEYYATKNKKRLDDIEKNTPDEMKALNNWCVFKTHYNKESGSKKKFILSAENGTWAKSNDPTTWSSFDTAIEYARKNNCEGLSFALESKNRIICVDLDHCINDKNMRSELCWEVLNKSQGTYAEKSVSNKGVHVFMKGDDITKGYNILNEQNAIECYDSNKFMSITGKIISKQNALKECSESLKETITRNLGEKKIVERERPSYSQGFSPMSNNELVEKIRSSKVGSTFDALYGGQDICGDESRSDAKLLNILAFFSNGDKSQMKDVFMDSRLYRTEKGEKYLDRTIDFVVDTLRERPKNISTVKSSSKTKNK